MYTRSLDSNSLNQAMHDLDRDTNFCLLPSVLVNISSRILIQGLGESCVWSCPSTCPIEIMSLTSFQHLSDFVIWRWRKYSMRFTNYQNNCNMRYQHLVKTGCRCETEICTILCTSTISILCGLNGHSNVTFYYVGSN